MNSRTGKAEQVTFAGGVLDRYRHVCAFVTGGAEQQQQLLDPFAVEGIDEGDRLLYIVDPAAPAEPVNRLRRLGYDVGSLLEEHRCQVRTWNDTYLRGGSFDQWAMLEQLETMLGSQSSPRIRMIADMGWAESGLGVADALIEFEARANLVQAEYEHVVVCAYDPTKFDGAFIVDILRTHPLVVIGGILQENPFFIPSSEFLEGRGLPAGTK